MNYKHVHYLVVNENHEKQRIDNFLLGYLKKVPKGLIYKIIRKGEVRVNSKRVKPTYKIKLNDKVRIPPIRFDEQRILNSDAVLIKVITQTIIFENDDFMVLNKPSGIAVHKGTGNDVGIIEVLKSGTRNFVELVHRLDKGTSGCLLIAKSRKTLLALQKKLKGGRFKKKYLALTWGLWQKKQTTVKKPIALRRKRNAEKIMYISEEGKYAESIFTLIKNYQNISLMEVDLKTGKTHQIRVHAQSEGHALVGDSKYSSEDEMKKAKQLGIYQICLHAQKLSFTLDKAYQFEATIPDNYNKILDNL